MDEQETQVVPVNYYLHVTLSGSGTEIEWGPFSRSEMLAVATAAAGRSDVQKVRTERRVG